LNQPQERGLAVLCESKPDHTLPINSLRKQGSLSVHCKIPCRHIELDYFMDILDFWIVTLRKRRQMKTHVSKEVFLTEFSRFAPSYVHHIPDFGLSSRRTFTPYL
jgi:hypothetical protein